MRDAHPGHLWNERNGGPDATQKSEHRDVRLTDAGCHLFIINSAYWERTEYMKLNPTYTLRRA